MNYIKMFIAGIAFPSTLLPLVLFTALMTGKYELLYIPFLHFIPFIWGVWNVLYFTVLTKILPGNTATRILLTGAILGLLIAAYGIFCLHLPRFMGIHGPLRFLPLVVGPVVYALLWLYVVTPINRLLGVSDVR